MRVRRWIGPKWTLLLFSLLLLASGPGQTAPGTAPEAAAQHAEASASLAGRFLVATPELIDPNFSETVIYMVEHSDEGAMGLVINRPLGQAPLGRLLEKLEGNAVASDKRIRIYAGGPVEPKRGFVLYSNGAAPDAGRAADAGIELAVSANLRVLHALAEGKGPPQAIFLLGYAGWGPGQLEGEIAQGAWDIIAPDAGLAFDEPDASRWKQALARHGIDL